MSTNHSAITPQQLFSEVATPNIQRSTFPRNHFWSATFPGDKLIPIFWDMAYPGDTFDLKFNGMIRYNTLIKPIQAYQSVDFHFFQVPIRLVFDNFKKLMGEKKNPADHINYLMPTVTSNGSGFDFGTNYDYLGVPPKIANTELRADVLRALHAVYNRWYRDQNLQDSIYCPTDDGPDDPTKYADLLPRAKSKDYFTSALPWPQKGDAVQLPIGEFAPIISDGTSPSFSQLNNMYEGQLRWSTTAALTMSVAPTNNFPLKFAGDKTGLRADLSEATQVTINAFRQANMLQVFLERDARGGTRYNELTYSHFGVMSPDARVQDPEYIGGYSTDVNITAIQQTSESATSPQGNLAAMGTITFSNAHAFTKSFTEHSIVLGLMSVKTDQIYQQGLDREWSRRSRYDFYWPEFAHLGEQAILNQEIYLQSPSVIDPGTGEEVNKQVFGYQERFGEMRYKQSTVHGLYRSSHPQSLDVWHLAQDFANLPTLSEEFIVSDTPYERVVAVTNEPDFNGQIYFDYDCTRPMPVRSIPSLGQMI